MLSHACEDPTATQPSTRDLDPLVDSLGSGDPVAPKGMRRLDPITNSLAGAVKGQITPQPSTVSNLRNVSGVALRGHL
ncbi:MAG: hypothetical protein ACI8S6_002696 [Myxococcota bacterium]